MAEARPVIGSLFIAPQKFNIMVNRSCGGHLDITDTNDRIMFTIRSSDSMFHRQRLLRDEHGRIIATLREKNMSARGRWNVFRGSSSSTRDNIFSAVRNDMIPSDTHVNVFLANNTSDYCDFKIRGNWSNRNCIIYKGYSSQTIIAQMHLSLVPEKFMVTIYPKVDYAFVVALISIVDDLDIPLPDGVLATAKRDSDKVDITGAPGGRNTVDKRYCTTDGIHVVNDIAKGVSDVADIVDAISSLNDVYEGVTDVVEIIDTTAGLYNVAQSEDVVEINEAATAGLDDVEQSVTDVGDQIIEGAKEFLLSIFS